MSSGICAYFDCNSGLSKLKAPVKEPFLPGWATELQVKVLVCFVDQHQPRDTGWLIAGTLLKDQVWFPDPLVPSCLMARSRFSMIDGDTDQGSRSKTGWS